MFGMARTPPARATLQDLYDSIEWVAPGFEVVRGWRIEQERELRARAAPDAPGLMGDAEVARFIQHYERLTRHILAEMPARADCVARLAADRSLLSVHGS